MQRHPHFELWLHDDDELAAILGSAVTQRVTLHEWPLSCVQRIQFGANETRIYKVQSEPTVEPNFYQNACSPILVDAQIILVEGGPPALLMEDLLGQTLHKLSLSESEGLHVVEDLLTQINEIEGNLPLFADICSKEKWFTHGKRTIQNLSGLVENRIFHQVDEPMIDTIAAFIHSPQVVAAFDEPIGYVHSDLTCENILMVGNDYRIIDWQRPIRGPIALDRLTLLNSLGIDPTPVVSEGIRQLYTLLQIDWFAQTALTWFPEGAQGYDEQIAIRINQLMGNNPQGEL